MLEEEALLTSEGIVIMPHEKYIPSLIELYTVLVVLHQKALR